MSQGFDLKVLAVPDEGGNGLLNICLRGVNALDTLEKIRDRINKKSCGKEFIFTRHGVPISEKQEAFLTLHRITEKLPSDEKVIHVKILSKTEDEDVTRQNLGLGEKYHVYSAEEIKLSRGIELQKRLYWNSRMHDLSEDIKLKRCSKFEAYGIIDVEWTLKRTEILKVMSDKAMRLLQQRNVNDGVTTMVRKCESYEKDIGASYERLLRADIDVKSCYGKIEGIERRKADGSKTLTDTGNRLHQNIDQEHETFDKKFTELKRQQAAIQKAIKALDAINTDSSSTHQTSTTVVASKEDGTSFMDSEAGYPLIEKDDLEELVESVNEDYIIEEIES